ncbi:596_t:CDS:1 [Funneliformis caledonium]|uniref:596_t:CDS:1 n=1 Tax=Funneliformis caledonium TaxID=1117310 RepID=A0A9N8WAM6_9GLOM|nr:596_t:CDS:1 [Funneliformis caledonium]
MPSSLTPFIQKINLNNHNNGRISKRKTPNLCPDCKNTDHDAKLFSNRITRVEEIIDNFNERLQKKNPERFSIFNAKFTLNSVPCELEYDLASFSLEELQKLANFTTQNFN